MHDGGARVVATRSLDALEAAAVAAVGVEGPAGEARQVEACVLILLLYSRRVVRGVVRHGERGAVVAVRLVGLVGADSRADVCLVEGVWIVVVSVEFVECFLVLASHDGLGRDLNAGVGQISPRPGRVIGVAVVASRHHVRGAGHGHIS